MDSLIVLTLQILDEQEPPRGGRRGALAGRRCSSNTRSILHTRTHTGRRQRRAGMMQGGRGKVQLSGQHIETARAENEVYAGEGHRNLAEGVQSHLSTRLARN